MQWNDNMDEAPRDGTEFQLWVETHDNLGYWVPVARFDNERCTVPSFYLFESAEWKKVPNRSFTKLYWMNSVKPPSRCDVNDVEVSEEAKYILNLCYEAYEDPSTHRNYYLEKIEGSAERIAGIKMSHDFVSVGDL